MTRYLLVLALLATSIAGAVPARAIVACEVSGQAGTFQVKKIHAPTPLRLSLDLELRLPLVSPDGNESHIFGGVWLLHAWGLDTYSYLFLDNGSGTGPSRVRAVRSGQGVDLPLPTQNLLLSGRQGAWSIQPWLEGDFYLVGFGAGYGSYTGTVAVNGPFDGTCEEVPDVPGTIFDIDATDFQGGEQVMVPGHGTAKDAKASFHNPHRVMVGGMFAYEPAPYPPAWIRIEHDTGSWLRHQYVGPVGKSQYVDARNWTATANYTGRTDTIGLYAAGLDLEPFF